MLRKVEELRNNNAQFGEGTENLAAKQIAENTSWETSIFSAGLKTLTENARQSGNVDEWRMHIKACEFLCKSTGDPSMKKEINTFLDQHKPNLQKALNSKAKEEQDRENESNRRLDASRKKLAPIVARNKHRVNTGYNQKGEESKDNSANLELARQKKAVIDKLDNYISWWKPLASALFRALTFITLGWVYKNYGHHHNNRAIAVKEAIDSCLDTRDISNILKNQKDILENKVVNTDVQTVEKYKHSDEGEAKVGYVKLLEDCWAKRSVNKHDAKTVDKFSGYYKAINGALTEIENPPYGLRSK